MKSAVPDDGSDEPLDDGSEERDLPDQNLALPVLPAVPIPVAPAFPDGLPPRAIVLIVVATFGGAVSTLVPMAFSLALRVDQLAPGRPELLGYILAASATAALIATPLTGVLSDRTCTRWGRRRPFTVGGVALGLAAVPVLILAHDIPTLGLGWVLCSLGFGTAGSSLRNFQADHLSRQQRGKVSGITSLTMQVSPVIGILVAGAVAHSTVLLFLLPSLLGATCLLLFAVIVPEPSTADRRFGRRLSLMALLRSYGFRPRDAPDFAWLWAGRFVVFSGLAFTTSYSTFFYAQRLGLPVADVAAILAVTSLLSIASLGSGSLGAGWLSDRFGRRRPFVAIGGVISAIGCVVAAGAWNLPVLLTGSFLMSFGVAVFMAVSSAITLDVLPERDTQAGRYMAITMFSQRIPTVIAPLVAPLLLAVPGAPASGNFAVLYVAAGLLVVSGCGVIAARVRGVA